MNARPITIQHATKAWAQVSVCCSSEVSQNFLKILLIISTKCTLNFTKVFFKVGKFPVMAETLKKKCWINFEYHLCSFQVKFINVLNTLSEVRGLFKKYGTKIFCLFFRQRWNKLPRGECLGGLYYHTVKIGRFYVCFTSCFSLVKVELPVVGAAKFEICVVIRFLHAESASYWNSKIQNEMSPPLWV